MGWEWAINGLLVGFSGAFGLFYGLLGALDGPSPLNMHSVANDIVL